MIQRCPRKGAFLYHDVLPGALYPGTARRIASYPDEQNRGEFTLSECLRVEGIPRGSATLKCSRKGAFAYQRSWGGLPRILEVLGSYLS